MAATFESLMTICEKIAPVGQSPLTPFWEEQSKRLYYGMADVFVGECGRGSIKSGWGSRIALNEVLFGDHEVPPGEVHFWVDVSENVLEARQRLGQYAEWLEIIGIPFERRQDEIVLRDLRRGFLVRAANVGRLSGFRALGLRIDEAAKISSNDADANPLPELWASGTAMLVSHLKHRPKRLLLSSPLACLGFFHETVRRGDTEDQIVAANTPTWIANPSITEAQTRKLEPDPRIWAREYLAVPQNAISAAFDADDVSKAFRDVPAGYTGGGWTLVIDPSGGGHDGWAWAMCAWFCAPRVPEFLTREVYLGGDTSYLEYERDENGEPIPNPRFAATNKPPILRVAEYGQLRNARAGGITLSQIVADLARNYCRPNGVHTVVSDGYEEFALTSEFARHGIQLKSFRWTPETKMAAVIRTRAMLRDGLLAIQADRPSRPQRFEAELRRQFLQHDERVKRSGNTSFSGRGTTADDLIATVLLCARADEEGLLNWSPYLPPQRDHAAVYAELERRFGDGDAPMWQPARRISAEHRALDAADRARPGGATPLFASTRAALARLSEDS